MKFHWRNAIIFLALKVVLKSELWIKYVLHMFFQCALDCTHECSYSCLFEIDVHGNRGNKVLSLGSDWEEQKLKRKQGIIERGFVVS